MRDKAPTEEQVKAWEERERLTKIGVRDHVHNTNDAGSKEWDRRVGMFWEEHVPPSTLADLRRKYGQTAVRDSSINLLKNINKGTEIAVPVRYLESMLRNRFKVRS